MSHLHLSHGVEYRAGCCKIFFPDPFIIIIIIIIIHQTMCLVLYFVYKTT